MNDPSLHGTAAAATHGSRKLISVVSPCYNEQGNVRELARQIADVFAALPQYDYELIFADNCSTDGTLAELRQLATEDPRVRVIVNARNFGHIRSPFHAYLQSQGDAVVAIVSDLQEPPALIAQFLERWEAGCKIVVGVRTGSEETFPMKQLRNCYYWALATIADGDVVRNFTGFGLYDRKFIEILRTIDDPVPYFRGLISEVGFPRATVEYRSKKRARGMSKNNLYTLYDNAMLGFTNHSKLPLRLATITGFVGSLLCLLVGVAYLAYKLMYWDRFSLGVAPLVIGIFLLGSVQLFFLGIVGEYVGAIHTQVLKRPRVIESERINFSAPLVAPERSPT
jgi:glycosyltransferase involved in cell wall biosynthesis